MISNPVVYSAASGALVARYNVNPNGFPSYWSDDAIDPLRKEIKDHYIEEQERTCCYCGIPNPSNHGMVWTAEHVVPKALRPEFLFTEVNLAVACPECNQAKRNKQTLVDPSVSVYPLTADDFLVVHPHFDEWRDHILRDNVTYASFTEKGKWTIVECELNRLEQRKIGLVYPISDLRYEALVRLLLDGGSALQEIVDRVLRYVDA